MLQLVDVGRAFGQRPSRLLEFRQSGYDAETALAFDVAALEFAQRFERMRDATKQVPAPPAGKRHTPTQTVPKHSEDELLRVLGVDPEDEVALATVAGAMADIDWDAVDWDDDEDAPEGDGWTG